MSGTMVARFYEEKDTRYGTVYSQNGTPDGTFIQSGGWGDWYYSYIEWDLSLVPPAANTISCNMFLYCQYARTNDPLTKIRRVTSPWTEADVSYWNHPSDTTAGQIDMSYPAAEEQYHITNIASMYMGWVDGSYPNYGLKLHPTVNNQTGASFYSEDQPGINKDRYLEVVYTDSPSLVPVLYYPTINDLMDNGCNFTYEPTIWDFDWSDVPGATAYHLYVIADGYQNAAIDVSTIASSAYHFQTGYAGEGPWRWKVRSQVGGIWQDWSEKGVFYVEPLNTDCQ